MPGRSSSGKSQRERALWSLACLGAEAASVFVRPVRAWHTIAAWLPRSGDSCRVEAEEGANFTEKICDVI